MENISKIYFKRKLIKCLQISTDEHYKNDHMHTSVPLLSVRVNNILVLEYALYKNYTKQVPIKICNITVIEEISMFKGILYYFTNIKIKIIQQCLKCIAAKT